MKILFVRPNKDAFGFKPIGISLLSSIAKSVGWESDLYDTTEIQLDYTPTQEEYQEARQLIPVDFSAYDMSKKPIDLKQRTHEMIRKNNPDILAFSVLSDQYSIALKIAEMAKKYRKDMTILWGGIHITSDPEQVISNGYVDYACVGEGIDAFKEFLLAYESGGDLYGIDNIWGRNGNEIIRNALRPLRKNLDDLPYLDWTLYDKRSFCKPFFGKIYTGGEHMTNWGCVNKCTYCINHYLQKMYNGCGGWFMRRYSPERMVDELEWLVKEYNIEFFKFFDEDFLMRSTKNLEELSQLYAERVNVPFWIETNPKITTEKKVQLLKAMNCAGASLGIESGFPMRKKILNRIDSKEDIVNAFHLFRQYGMRTTAYNMFALPFETRKSYFQRVELNRLANPNLTLIAFYYPLKNTVLRKIAIDNGFFDPEMDTENWDPQKPCVHSVDMSSKEMIQLQHVFTLYVKLPKMYWEYIHRSEIQDDIGKKLRSKLVDIFDDTVFSNDGIYKDDGNNKKYIGELIDIWTSGREL